MLPVLYENIFVLTCCAVGVLNMLLLNLVIVSHAFYYKWYLIKFFMKNVNFINYVKAISYHVSGKCFRHLCDVVNVWSFTTISHTVPLCDIQAQEQIYLRALLQKGVVLCFRSLVCLSACKDVIHAAPVCLCTHNAACVNLIPGRKFA